MQYYLEQLKDLLTRSPTLSIQIVETVVVILILWLIRLATIRYIQKHTERKITVYKWKKNLTYVTFFIGAIVISQIWFSMVGSIGTFFGLLSAGLAFALRDPVLDLFAWMYIYWRKPFDLGDRIQVGETKGDVIDMRLFKFTLLEIGNWVSADQSTGRVIHIPNHKVMQEQVANYTSDFEFIWQEIEVLITFESDWKKAKTILQEMLDETMKDFIELARKQIKSAEKSYLIQYQYLTPIVYTSKKDAGICLTVRYLTNPRQRRSTSQAIWENIFDEFETHGNINFAYPTIRYYDKSDGESQ